MHQTDTSIIERTNVQTDAVIVNQCGKDTVEEILFINKKGAECKVKFICTKERGLSRSRNMALRNAWGDYCIFADDDEVLVEDYENIIESAFKRIPNADIIAFNYYDLNSRLKNNYKKPISEEKKSPNNHSYSSVALSFKLDSIISREVWFDSRIGAGSGIISAGEESVWQALARKKGLRMFQCPEYITTVTQANSTWFNGYDEKYFYDLGANLTARYGIIKYLYQFYYPYRLYKETKLSVFKQIYYMISGMKGFKKNMGYNQYFRK